jgi:hypothetical protein
MSARVDLYDSAYANYASEVYREVRNGHVWRGFWTNKLGNNGRVTGNPSSVDGSRLLGGLDDVNRLIEMLIVIGGHLGYQVGGCARPRDVR